MRPAGQLDHPRAGNLRCHPARALDGDVVLGAVEYERRHTNRRQHRAHVDLGVHARELHHGARARAQASAAGEMLDPLGRHVLPFRLEEAPSAFRRAPEPSFLFVFREVLVPRLAPREPRSANEARQRPVQHERP